MPSAHLSVSQARDRAHQWVGQWIKRAADQPLKQEIKQGTAPQFPQEAESADARTTGFVGAFIAGSATQMSDASLLPPSSDVDVFVVLADPPPIKMGKFVYRGALLEVSYLDAAHLRHPDQLLGQETAGSFEAAEIVADPTGHLASLQTQLTQDYPRRCWVQKRCANLRDRVNARIRLPNPDTPWHDQITSWSFGTSLMTYILLMAGLKLPTVRKRYLAARHLLQAYGRLDLYEALLETAGFAHIDARRTKDHLKSTAAALDSAKKLIQTPYRFASDISDTGRRIAIDGSQELIAAGNHREALFYLLATYSRCRHIFHTDAPEALQDHDPGYQAMLTDLGVASSLDLQQRCRAAREFLPQIWIAAEKIMASNKDIKE
jgi:hypothetical protein